MFARLLTLFTFCLLFPLLSGCITEIKGDDPFQKPDAAAMEKAHQLYVDIAYKHIQNKEYDRALQSIAKAMEIKPKSAMALAAEAEVFHRQKDMKLAEKSYKKAIGYDSKFMPVRLNYGNFLYLQGRYEEACEQYKVASSDVYYEMRSGASFNLGKCLLKLSRYDEAEKALTVSVNLDSKNTEALYLLANTRFILKDYSGAARYYRSYVGRSRVVGQPQSAAALWLGIRLERIFGNKDNEASFALLLKNLYPYSDEYLQYKNTLSTP